MKEPTCTQCHVTMEVGHLVDRSHSRVNAVIWASGPADWTGIVVWSLNSKLKGHDVYGVVTYRCPDCGHLSSFARTAARPNE